MAGVNQYTIEAQTENDCGKSELGTSNCEVTCTSLPCVRNAQCECTSESAFGESYTVKGSACNCSDRPEN